TQLQSVLAKNLRAQILQRRGVCGDFTFGNGLLLADRRLAIVVQLPDAILHGAEMAGRLVTPRVCRPMVFLHPGELLAQRPQGVVRLLQRLLLIQQLLNRRGGSAPVDTREVLQIQQRIGGAKALVLVVAPAGDPVPLLLYCYEPTLDRKSTRLNSSHVKISYAVFCLKKKKEIERSVAHAP